ncbi:hypothetical protein JCM17960_28170 [Magnetospira thiophila]
MSFIRPFAVLFFALFALAPLSAQAAEDDGYEKNEVLDAAKNFFGETSEGLASVIEKAFADHGKPNAIIVGEEASGAFFVGARYGEGELQTRSGINRKLYWQGPSLGFDWGGNASKVFTLIYHLSDPEELFQRFPGVDGSLYVVGGVGLNYQESSGIILAPIRTGVGLRAGANVGYLHYTKEKHLNPF